MQPASIHLSHPCIHASMHPSVRRAKHHTESQEQRHGGRGRTNGRRRLGGRRLGVVGDEVGGEVGEDARVVEQLLQKVSRLHRNPVTDGVETCGSEGERGLREHQSSTSYGKDRQRHSGLRLRWLCIFVEWDDLREKMGVEVMRGIGWCWIIVSRMMMTFDPGRCEVQSSRHMRTCECRQ
eukprot:1585880-Rhodomonas_salina.2